MTVPNFAQFAGGAADFGAAAFGLVADIAEKRRKQQEATATTEGEVAFDRGSMNELLRLETEGDPTQDDFIQNFDSFLGLGEQHGGLIGDILSKLPNSVSDEAREGLRLNLLKRGERVAQRAALTASGALQKRADDSVEAAVNVTVGQTERDPDALPDILGEIDRIVGKFADTMTPDAERDQRTAARQANIEAAARGFAEAGRFADARALLDGTYDEDLDPAARARIQATIERGEREADEVVRRDVVDAIAVLERGRTPAGLAVVQDAAKGTRFEAPLAEAVADRRRVAEFLRKPLADQAAELAGRPETTTRRDLATEGRMQRAHAALVKQIKDGQGLIAAAELGVISEIDPLDVSNPETLPETLRRRALQARMASDHFGVPVTPLLPAEADGIAKLIRAAPADAATVIIQKLEEGFGREATMAFVDQVADKSPELALATVNVAERPLLAREILQGGRLLKENKDVAPSKVDRQDAIAEVFGTEDRSVFTADTATALAPILDAGTALYAGRRVPTGDLTYDPDAYQTALREVVGGVFEFNGRNILAPIAGMSEDAFDDAMERLTQPDLIEFGNGVPLFTDGSPFTVDMFESSFFGPEAQLVTAGFGRYLVAFPGLGFVLTEAGEPYQLDLAKFISGQQ